MEPSWKCPNWAFGQVRRAKIKRQSLLERGRLTRLKWRSQVVCFVSPHLFAASEINETRSGAADALLQQRGAAGCNTWSKARLSISTAETRKQPILPCAAFTCSDKPVHVWLDFRRLSFPSPKWHRADGFYHLGFRCGLQVAQTVAESLGSQAELPMLLLDGGHALEHHLIILQVEQAKTGVTTRIVLFYKCVLRICCALLVKQTTIKLTSNP